MCASFQCDLRLCIVACFGSAALYVRTLPMQAKYVCVLRVQLNLSICECAVWYRTSFIVRGSPLTLPFMCLLSLHGFN